MLHVLNSMSCEPLTSIASKIFSLKQFLEHCLRSINPRNMSWMLPANAENKAFLEAPCCQELSEDDKRRV